ncbi:MAG: metallophosphoesterase [Pseudomonas sp.]|uniref:metallophosphoesterase n=1 Tax=Pseudomonas sp. TaxID=306 RepID=UPI0033973B02
MYDLIGDIHGYADPLVRLLRRLGYAERDGTWGHPDRQVIFLGDFVDRGPAQRETLVIVRHMVNAGRAQAVMGNHEFNAVAWASVDPVRQAEYLRPHSAKNRQQHQAFLTQLEEGSAAHRDAIEWFKSLPLYLDLDGLRVVHACWHPLYLAQLQPYLDDRQRILPDAWPALTAEGSLAFRALETVLKGLEVPLPEGVHYADKDGHLRNHIRTRWWSQHLTYRDLAMAPAEVIASLPHTPVPEDVLPGYDGEKPLFVGHYWLSGTPAPLSRSIACLDYSIAANDPLTGKGPGKLCAYRWQGERELTAEHFVWVEQPS